MAGSRLEKVGTIFTRKELMDKLFTNMGYLTSQYDKDLCLMKDNIKKLEVFTAQAIKSSKDTIKTFEWRVTGFKDLFKSFQDRVEGLLRCGGMRIEERPLWWDVYRAFPAAREPDFAKPVPKVPIRNIFYEEDALRAKFHKTGLPLGTVTLSDEKYKSNSQKAIDIYKKMSADSPGAGPALYDKCIAALEGELSSQKNYQQTRREELEVADEKPTTIAAMFAEGQKSHNTEQTIKNIFKD